MFNPSEAARRPHSASFSYEGALSNIEEFDRLAIYDERDTDMFFDFEMSSGAHSSVQSGAQSGYVPTMKSPNQTQMGSQRYSCDWEFDTLESPPSRFGEMDMLSRSAPAPSMVEQKRPIASPQPLKPVVSQSVSSSPGSFFAVDHSFPWEQHVPSEERRERIVRWKEKKDRILSGETQPKKYAVRRRVADNRMRVNGRFVSHDEDNAGRSI